MPYDVKEERRADSLTRGTRVMLPDMPNEVLYVQSATRKIKYVYLTLGPTVDGDTTERLQYELNATLTTVQQKLTESEQFDRDYRRALSWSEKELASSLADVPADYLTDVAQKWREGSYGGHVLDWSDSAQFFHLQAMYKAWRTVQHTFERLCKLYGADVTPLSAIVVELEQRDLDRRNHGASDPLSRSTNPISSLLDDLDRWSWDKLADTTHYYIADTVREHELKRLRTLADVRRAADAAAEAVNAR